MDSRKEQMDRRAFLKGAAGGAVAAGALAGGLPSVSAAEKKDAIWRNKQPGMEYRRLGRTNFMTSRIVAGWCKGDDRLREVLLARGINYFDAAIGYGDYEKVLRTFLKKRRDKVWVTSKATNIAGFVRLDAKLKKLYEKAMEAAKQGGKAPDLRPAGKQAAKLYLDMLDESLGRMQIDYVDCYMMHGINIPWFFDLTEAWEAFEKAKKAGKVGCWGYSVHENVANVLQRGLEADKKGPWKIDLIMPAVNPANYRESEPVLKELKARDTGLIAMKTTGDVRRAKKTADQVPETVEKAFAARSTSGDWKKWNKKERGYAYMLHCTETIDAIVSGMNSFEEVEKNTKLPAAKLALGDRHAFEAQVVMEQRGACHHCGDCTAACPEHIEVFNVLRYYAYHWNYDEKALAKALYKQLGMDPSQVCTSCGKCVAVCPEGIALNEVIMEAAKTLS